jgi:hypothetical protein
MRNDYCFLGNNGVPYLCTCSNVRSGSTTAAPVRAGSMRAPVETIAHPDFAFGERRTLDTRSQYASHER